LYYHLLWDLSVIQSVVKAAGATYMSRRCHWQLLWCRRKALTW